MLNKQSHILFKGEGVIDEKSCITSIDELSSLDTTYFIQGQTVFCMENGGHYIWYPYEGITTAPVSGNWYLYEQVQYDLMFPIGATQISMSSDVSQLPQPMLPAVATWTDITSTIDNRAPWVSSSSAGLSNTGYLPNIVGQLNYIMIDDSTDSFSGAFYQVSDGGGGWKGSNGDAIRNYAFNAARCSAVYGRSTTKDSQYYSVVRPTSVAVRLFQRTA